MHTTQPSEISVLVCDFLSISEYLLHHKPSDPRYSSQLKALREIKAWIAAFDPVALATATDPLDRRAIYERHIRAGGTLRDVATDLGLGYSTVHYYANRYLRDLVERSRENGRRAASKRLIDRLHGE